MFDLAVVQRLFAQKCGGKGLTVPSAADLLAIVGDSEELRSEWENMLEHQLPTLPGSTHIKAFNTAKIHNLRTHVKIS